MKYGPAVQSFFACVCLSLVQAQTPLVAKVENAIRSAEPEWRCTRGILNATPPLIANEKPLEISTWTHTSKSGKRESVEVNIFKVDSRSDASVSLSPVREGNIAPGWIAQRFQIGDEGYLITYNKGSRFAIDFRRDTKIVRVSSDSLRLAKRFALLVAAQLDDN
jgi:hypothetical protein